MGSTRKSRNEARNTAELKRRREWRLGWAVIWSMPWFSSIEAGLGQTRGGGEASGLHSWVKRRMLSQPGREYRLRSISPRSPIKGSIANAVP
jgi:hypothetical protein